MHALQQDNQLMTLQSEHFLANITLWLVLNHGSKLRVVVSGFTVYEKQLGPPK